MLNFSPRKEHIINHCTESGSQLVLLGMLLRTWYACKIISMIMKQNMKDFLLQKILSERKKKTWGCGAHVKVKIIRSGYGFSLDHLTDQSPSVQLKQRKNQQRSNNLHKISISAESYTQGFLLRCFY